MRFIRRYKSEIYGNYRRAALVDGFVASVVMAAYVLISSLVGLPVSAPETYVTDGLMLIAVFVGAYLYRKSLSEVSVSLKELLLLGLDMGVVIGIVYGLLLWVIMLGVYPDLIGRFAEFRIWQMDDAATGEAAAEAIKMVRLYGAGDWAFIGGFRSFVMSILFTFFAALIFGTRPQPKAE